ncbi:MAG: hypothetical protein BroJett040_11090 [Oligoflexia bacterium]|nr:MAG: hypothetical protein BroJett040_11090 [Oligoflexia bacterium]
MKLAFLISILFSLFTYSQTTMRPLYYGATSNEVQLSFEYFLELEGPQAPEKTVRVIIDRQLTHLFGSLSNNSTKGVPKAEHQVSLLQAEPIARGFRYHYHYTGKILVDRPHGSTYTFALPRDPTQVYSKGVVNNRGQLSYPCTDSHYWHEQYFWYFWSPTYRGCPLKKGVDYDFVNGLIDDLPNTDRTYPEYEKLVGPDQKISLTVLMGMDDESKVRNPYLSTDIAAYNYRALTQQLTRMGYQIVNLSATEIQKLSPGATTEDITVQRAIKSTLRGQIEILLFFGPTSLYGGSHFHHFIKYSLENDSVMIYAGHSGLGEYLNLTKIEMRNGFKVAFPEKYQIYFFNGCSSYPYYNSYYFSRKGGTKNLDILTNGLATYFSAIVPSTYQVIKAIDQWATSGRKVSYQEIIEEADSNNLLGVNGDEDNPTEP